MYDRIHRAKNLAGLKFSCPAKIFTFSHRLIYHTPDGLRRLPLHPLGSVGVGVQREPRAVVSQGVGEGLHINAMLQRQGGERVSEIVKSDMLDPCRRQDLLVGMAEGVRVIHCPRLGRGEHIRVVRVLLVFQNEQIYRLLRDGDGADGVAGLGLAHLQLTVDAVYLFGHRDGHVFHVQVSPEEGQQLTPAQAAGEFQVVGRKEAAPVGLLEVSTDLLGEQHLHLLLFDLGELAPLRWIGGDQPLLHRLIQCRSEYPVDAVDEAVAQALVLQLNVGVPLNPSGGFQLVVELLDLNRGKLVQADRANAGDDVLLDIVVVVVRCLLPDGGFGVGLEP